MPDPSAQAFVLNATVVPPGLLAFLTLWPQGTTQPLVSTLNAIDGAVSSNLAIVPATNGSVLPNGIRSFSGSCVSLEPGGAGSSGHARAQKRACAAFRNDTRERVFAKNLLSFSRWQ